MIAEVKRSPVAPLSCRLSKNQAIGQRVPCCQWRYWAFDEQDGQAVLWLLDFESRSWAMLTHSTPDASEGEFLVRQHGPRRLWDEVGAAHQWWVDHGKPSVDRWSFTVTAAEQRIEIRSN